MCIYKYMCIYMHIYLFSFYHFKPKSSTIHGGSMQLKLESILIWSLGIMLTSFAFLFQNEIIFKKAKQFVQISSRRPVYVYTCVIRKHIQINICRILVHLDFSCCPGVSSRLLGSHASTSHAVTVIMCTPTPVNNKEDTDITPSSPSAISK